MCETTCTEDYILTEIDWWEDEPEPEKTKTQEEKDAQYWQEIRDCGKPIRVWDAKTGCLKVIKHRRCKHYRDCRQCQQWRISEEYKKLLPFTNEARYLETSEDEAKKLVRKYGSNSVRRVPLEDGSVSLVIKTDDEIGQDFTHIELNKVSVNSVPLEEDRRVSGKLGVTPVVVKKEKEDDLDWDELEREAEKAKYTVEIHQRQMCFDFDSKDKNAPKDIQTLEKMVQAEVDIFENPSTGDKLQDAIYVCEQKTQEICEKYEMSFSFLIKRVIDIDIREVKWKWTLNKRKPA